MRRFWNWLIEALELHDEPGLREQASASSEPATFDAVRLAHDVRRGDPQATALAFRQVFDTGLGRVVLATHLAECGVGNPIGRAGMSAEEMFYAVGRHDAAIELAARVYDPAALAVSVITGTLEEKVHEAEIHSKGEFARAGGAHWSPDDEG